MAENENIYGIRYEVDIEQLKSSTQEAGKQIKLANAQFKESTSKLDNWATSIDGVTAKKEQLISILEAEKTKLAHLKSEYNDNLDTINKYDKQIADLKAEKEKAIEQYGKESAEVEKLSLKIAGLERKQATAVNQVDKLKVSILNQQASVNKTEKEIDKYDKKLQEMQNESSKTVSSMDKLKKSINEQEKELGDLKGEYANVVLEQGKTSTEAQQLANKIRGLNGDLQENKKKLSEAEKEADSLTKTLEDVGDGTKEAGGGFTIMKGALADLTANAISGAISKVGEFIGSLFDLTEATEEYRQMNAKIEGSANNFGYSVEFAKDKYKEFYGYLKDDQASTNAITNLMGLGTSTENLTKLTEGAIGVWASYGDSIPIESLTESINETVQVAKVTGTFADTLNWAKISLTQWEQVLGKGTKEQKIFSKAKKEGMTNEDAFNEVLEKTTSQQERANIVAKFLNETYGESKKTYDNLNEGMNELNESEVNLKDSQAKLGESMQPVNTAINNLKAKALDVVAPVVEKFAKGFLDLNNYLKDNPTAMKIVETTVIALAGAFGVLAGALMIQGLIMGVQKALALLNMTMLANPYVLIASLIVGIVAGFIYLWNTSEGFRNFWINIWDSIVETTKNVVDTIVNFFTVTIPEAFNNFGEYVKDFSNKVQTFFKNMWNGVINFFTSTIPKWIDNVIKFFEKIPYYLGYMVGQAIGHFVKWGIDLWKFATVTVPKFVDEVIKWFASLPGKVWTWLVNTFNKVVQWGSNTIAKGKEVGSNFINSIVSFLSQLPSKVWNYLSSVISNVVTFGSNMASRGAEAGKKLFNSVVDGVKNLPSKMGEIAIDVVKGFGNGITDMVGWVGKKVTSFGKGVMDGLKDFFGIHSPAKATYWVGDMLTRGLGNAIVDGTSSVVKKAENMASNVMGTMKDNLSEKVAVGYELVNNAKERTAGLLQSISTPVANDRLATAGATNNVNNVTFNQYNSSPKNIDSLETYRNTQKQLKQYEIWKGGK